MLKEYSATDVYAVHENQFNYLLTRLNDQIYRDMILCKLYNTSLDVTNFNKKILNDIVLNFESKGFIVCLDFISTETFISISIQIPAK